MLAHEIVDNARRLHPQADFWVAIEAGIDDDATFSWVVIDNAAFSAVKRDRPRCAARRHSRQSPPRGEALGGDVPLYRY